MLPLNIEISVNTEIRRMKKNGWIVVNHFFDILKIIHRRSATGEHEIDLNDHLMTGAINTSAREDKIKMINKLFRKSNTIKCHIHKNHLDPRRRFDMRLSFVGYDIVITSLMVKGVHKEPFLRFDYLEFEKTDERKKF